MNCPVCGEPLIIVERNNIEVDYCPVCHSFWLDNGELELLDEMLGTDAEIMTPFGRPFITTKEKTYKCPKCSKNMGKIELNGIILDVCPKAEGVWFDAGELSKVLSNKNSSEEKNIVSFLGEIFNKS